MFRPGNLEGLGMTSKASRKQPFGYVSRGIGAFGKGYIAPPPGPPPGGAAPGSKVDTAAWDRRSGKHYLQDPKCQAGQKMTRWSESCTGPDCDPGEKETGEECDDDPNYLEFPEGSWVSCGAVKADPRWRSVPGKLVDDFCTREDLPDKAQAQVQAREENTDALEAELQQLEMEHSKVNQIVTQGPPMPLPSSYTGGGMPVITQRRQEQTVTDNDRISAMVSAHETKKAIQRSTPAPPIQRAPVAAPTIPTTAASEKKDIGGMFSWLRAALFGSSTTLGEFNYEDKSTTIVTPIIVGLGLLLLMKRSSL